MLSPLRVSLFRLQRNETLGLRTTWNISGLNTFTCVAADFLPHPGFMHSVTALHAEFSTELVVSLCSGWIVQLVNDSFSWRTHYDSFRLLLSFFYINPNVALNLPVISPPTSAALTW
jgi:hypothetical protein